MREFQDKRYWKVFFKSRYFIVLLIIIIGLIAHGVWNAYVRYDRSVGLVTSLEAEKTRLVDRQRDLSYRVASLETPEGVDREIRNTYSLVKSGEELIVVVGDRSSESSDTASNKKSWWDKFLDLFR